MPRGARSARGPVLGIGAVLLPIACCAAVPLLAGVVAGVGAGAVIGIALGGLAAAAVAVGVFATVRRRACRRDLDREEITS
jgi:uncharacterized protein (DUF58 family)